MRVVPKVAVVYPRNVSLSPRRSIMENSRFPKYRRMTKPAAFNAAYRGNQTRVKGQYFTVLAFNRLVAVANANASDTITNDLLDARLGVVASKKVSKLAVQRNRLKRLMRESFRMREHPNGFDFVVIARPAAAMAKNALLQKELHTLWKRLHQRCAALSLP